jgi:flagellar hook-associated protein 1 FlgK
MSGGSLGGLLRFRDEVLDESHNALGRVAIGLASAFNDQHTIGMDLDGDLGGDFFATLGQPEVLAAESNPGVTASFTTIDELTTHEYQVNYNSGTWSMTDLTTGTSVSLDAESLAAGVIAVDSDPAYGVTTGFEIAFVPDDFGTNDNFSYRIRPTRLGANAIDVAITNERDIAAGAYLATLTGAASGPANTGTGAISSGRLESLSTSGTPTTALPTIAIQYNGGNLSLSGGPGGVEFVDADGTSLGDTVGYSSGQTYRVNINGLGTFSFEMTGSPDDTDTFRIIDNSGRGGDPIGVGDNRNARSLADLQNANLMIGGTATLANTYGTLVADVGTRAQQAQNNASIQENLLGQAEAAKSEVSGVNLDEEAADLVRFQQAYQAAAQVINVANSLFDTLLGAMRR